MKTFILLSAIPGSGKSTWAKLYQKVHPNTFIVSSDEIRRRLTGNLQSFSKEDEVWETYLKEINVYADQYKDVTVIGDATNLQNKYRKYYLEQTPNFDRHVLVLFNIPYEICLIQNKLRPKDKIVPPEGMESLRKEYEIPSQEVIDLYDEYRVIGPNFVSNKVKEKK